MLKSIVLVTFPDCAVCVADANEQQPGTAVMSLMAIMLSNDFSIDDMLDRICPVHRKVVDEYVRVLKSGSYG